MRFTARTADGREVDSSSSARGDAFFIVGEEPPRVPGLDVAVTGLTKGAKATKTVPAAFGPRSDEAIIRIPAAMAPPGLEAGDSVRMGDGSPGLITSVSASEVVVDVNHPLAGQDVVLDVELVAHTPKDKLQFFVGGLVRSLGRVSGVKLARRALFSYIAAPRRRAAFGGPSSRSRACLA